MNEYLTKEEIDFILNDSFDFSFWLYQMGVSISDNVTTDENRFNFPFLDYGKEYWEKLQDKIANVICDRSKKEPKEIVNSMLDGDIRNIVTVLAQLISKDLELDKTIIIPVTALLLKSGIKRFCAKA